MILSGQIRTAESILSKITGNIRRNAPLSEYSSWRIGGPADFLVEPAGDTELMTLVQRLRESEVSWFLLGAGTNLLFDDEGFRGVVVRMAAPGLAHIETDKRIGMMSVGAAAWTPAVALAASRAGLSGLEHTVGIPGTFGGLVAMNGGSQRRSISECIRRVKMIDASGNTDWWTPGACKFAYRSSRFLKDAGLIVTETEMQLTSSDPQSIRRQMRSILKKRRGKFPRKTRNCGSVFRSDPETYARLGPPGKIIESLGLKGYRVGDAEVSPQHANFIVNCGKASSRDVLSLIQFLKDRVHEQTGFRLECEVRYVPTSSSLFCARLCTVSMEMP